MVDVENSKYAPKAEALFREGYNCAQSVVLAFADKYDIDFDTAAKISSSFGGGLGRLREVCGCVSGMSLALGLIQGYYKPKDIEGKANQYKMVQELVGAFKEENGSYICRELLSGITGDTNPKPEARTTEYYKKRPCPKLCGIAAAILEEKLGL